MFSLYNIGLEDVVREDRKKTQKKLNSIEIELNELRDETKKVETLEQKIVELNAIVKELQDFLQKSNNTHVGSPNLQSNQVSDSQAQVIYSSEQNVS